jgi:mRNA interferase MazF
MPIAWPPVVSNEVVWFAAAPGGDRPVLVLTRDPVADRIGSVVVAALTRTRRGLVSELDLTSSADGLPTDCVVNFDNVHTLPRDRFRRRVTMLSAARMSEACRTLSAATGC